MILDERMMRRCFELAQKGLGSVAPNPMVGCVIALGNRIIGEGYHQKYGGAHAEVNAIRSVKNSELLKKATLYVNLEPCSHHGKTPPCSELIIKMGIPKVIVSNLDPNPKVAGKGVEQLQKSGVEVIHGILEKEGDILNQRFFTFHRKKRPYIVLKWAKTLDGFMDIDQSDPDKKHHYWITNPELKQWVHKWRSEETAIVIGAQTAINDNPILNVREWEGTNPIRIVVTKDSKLPSHLNIFNNLAKTIVFTSLDIKYSGQTTSTIQLKPEVDFLKNVLFELYKLDIQSVFVEGGYQLLHSLIEMNIWDEARVLTGNKYFQKGQHAPKLVQNASQKTIINEDLFEFYTNHNSI